MVYVMSDLCGCLNSWKKMLRKIGFTDRDEMYVLGNVMDGGKFPMETLGEMMSYSNIYPVLGAGEYRFLRVLKGIPFDAKKEDVLGMLSDKKKEEFLGWMKRGGKLTFESYMERDPEDREAIMDYIGEFALYEEVKIGKEKFFLSHSGIKDFVPGKALDSYKPVDFLADRPEKGRAYFEDRMMIVGHTPTLSYEDCEPGKIYSTEYFINVNCGILQKKSGGTLGCLCLNQMSEIYLLSDAGAEK